MQDFTLVIPTYNRPRLLEALLTYLGAQPQRCHVLVLDSSQPQPRAANRKIVELAKLKLDYAEFPSEMHPFDKFREGVHKVTTEFCALCADDDLVLLDGVQHCLEALRSNPVASVAQGYSFSFLCPQDGDMDLGNVLYFTSTIDDATPLARLAKLFARYQAATYGNYRTPVLQRIFDTLKPMRSILARELLGTALAAIEGQMLRVACFSHGRSMDTSESYEHWHPLEWFAKDSQGLFSEYHSYRELMAEAVQRVLDWSGEANFKRTLNQNYFNFIPIAADDARMVRMRRLVRDFAAPTHEYEIDDPDCDPSSWISFYPDYYIFKEPDRANKLAFYREYLSLMYEYALCRDRSGLLRELEEPKLGNPIRVYRNDKLISQDLVNSVRERNSILAGMEPQGGTHFNLAELGAGYGRLGYIMLKTTGCRYFVFDIPPALYLSQWYLTTLFPKRRAFRFRHFEAFEEIEGELAEADVAFFTPNQLAKFPATYFDVFASISSIHEMRRDQISHYMALMGRTTKSTLYLKQQKDYVNPIDNLVIGKDDYPVPAGWAPSRERFDLINPGFFERIYRRNQPAS
jgi:putative sugar O-methyltransferase